MKLKDSVAVVAGAGGGIGRASALALARRGCHLVLADIDEGAVAQTGAQAITLGVRASSHRLDVASREQVSAFPDAVLGAHGRVDMLIALLERLAPVHYWRLLKNALRA